MAIKGTHVQIGTPDVVFLERRGGSSHRGSGDFSRSEVLHRALETLRAFIAHADPRPRLKPAVYEAAIALLPAAWTLRPIEIEHLETVLARADDLGSVLRAHRLQPGPFLDAITALSPFEKLALVDHAIQAHAPAASGVKPQER